MIHQKNTHQNILHKNIHQEDIYLIGSFFDFRDKIIKNLSQFSFSDPRNHRQASMAKLVIDDLGAAEKCPVSLVVFPKNKSRGVMTYAEIGVAFAHNNYIIIIDENEEKDELLQKIANKTYNDIDLALEDLKNFKIPQIKQKSIKSKYLIGTKEKIPIKRVCFSGELDENLEYVINESRKKRQDREFVFVSNPFEELQNFIKNDIFVAYYPDKQKEWKRDTTLLLGTAYAYDITSIICDEHKNWKHPPLQAIARRQTSIKEVIKYVTQVEDLNISSEALNMYSFL